MRLVCKEKFWELTEGTLLFPTVVEVLNWITDDGVEISAKEIVGVGLNHKEKLADSLNALKEKFWNIMASGWLLMDFGVSSISSIVWDWA